MSASDRKEKPKSVRGHLEKLTSAPLKSTSKTQFPNISIHDEKVGFLTKDDFA